VPTLDRRARVQAPDAPEALHEDVRPAGAPVVVLRHEVHGAGPVRGVERANAVRLVVEQQIRELRVGEVPGDDECPAVAPGGVRGQQGEVALSIGRVERAEPGGLVVEQEPRRRSP
jgi:hypothetical protein